MSPAPFKVDVDALLAPASASAPAGVDLRYLPVYDEIKNLRKSAEAEPTELAPWKKVADLGAANLPKSKDLQLAIWFLEALVKLDGYPGAATGIIVVRRIIADFWDGLFPPIDPEDDDPLGFRRSVLHWIDEKLPPLVKLVPLTPAPTQYGLLHYEVTQKTGDEKKALLDEGWPSSDQFEKALQDGSVEHLERVLAEVTTCEAELAALQEICDQRFAGPGDAVSFLSLKGALGTARWLLERPLKKKRGTADAAAGGDAEVAADGTVRPASSASGDGVWTEALTLTRDSKVDGLRLLQAQVADASGGRDRFLKQLLLAELCLEAAVETLAFPIFDELARTIETRQLEEWEDRAVITRAWTGLVKCCERIERHVPAAGVRGREIADRLARLGTPSSS